MCQDGLISTAIKSCTSNGEGTVYKLSWEGGEISNWVSLSVEVRFFGG